jgi:hypothetical protein
LIWLNSFIPEKLPQGMTEFNRWVDEISHLSGLPLNDKLRKVISQLIISLPPQVAYVKKRYIVTTIQKAAANQVAFEMLRTIPEENDWCNEHDTLDDCDAKQQKTTQEINSGVGQKA